MKIISKLRHLCGNYDFKRRYAGIRSDKKTVNINDAQNIGLLYQVPEEYDYQKIVEFIKKLQAKGKKVFALGFVNNRDVPAFFSSSNSYSFFTLKDLNWYHKPHNTFVSNFLTEKFDIVINLSLHDTFPLQYICGLSGSKLKVGKYGKGNDRYYDLMIDTEKIDSLDVFIEQITHYLSVIKNKNYE